MFNRQESIYLKRKENNTLFNKTVSRQKNKKENKTNKQKK